MQKVAQRYSLISETLCLWIPGAAARPRNDSGGSHPLFITGLVPVISIKKSVASHRIEMAGTSPDMTWGSQDKIFSKNFRKPPEPSLSQDVL
ncbi:hypothetical protein BB934_26545 [Microvirga ossetica]|uniref:Uncharacterized protein n=1 Tax=Microvirga ossetica TaxID=1882682 RepID=A0A1B2EN14_9HYPH|nr:hypothetical protein BB934_26545 [Microvirga ossetica]